MNLPLKIGQPRFLSEAEVLTLHAMSLRAYGGGEGVLDQGRLDAALAMPRQGVGENFVHEFPFGMAAAYGYHLAMGHAFRDGNKRTAFAAMVAFLRMNGWNFELPDTDAAQLMLDLIEKRDTKEWLTTRIGAASRPRVSMEMRDFMRSLTDKDFVEFVKGHTAGPIGEAQTTMGEVADAIPLAGQLQQYLETPISDKEQHQTIARIQVLFYMYRKAEDLGYEW
jgi:death-on-curing protein